MGENGGKWICCSVYFSEHYDIIKPFVAIFFRSNRILTGLIINLRAMFVRLKPSILQLIYLCPFSIQGDFKEKKSSFFSILVSKKSQMSHCEKN